MPEGFGDMLHSLSHLFSVLCYDEIITNSFIPRFTQSPVTFSIDFAVQKLASSLAMVSFRHPQGLIATSIPLNFI